MKRFLLLSVLLAVSLWLCTAADDKTMGDDKIRVNDENLILDKNFFADKYLVDDTNPVDDPKLFDDTNLPDDESHVDDESPVVDESLVVDENLVVDNNTCDADPVDCDCKYINQNLDEFCRDEANWGEMSGCHVDLSGLNYSVSWCPKFIRNASCVSNIMLRVNFFNIIRDKSFTSGDANVVAFIPGFDRPIFTKTWSDEECEKLKAKLKGSVPDIILEMLKCPLSFNEVAGFAKYLKKPKTLSNPLPTIVPAGSYHLLTNVTTSNKDLFLCIDGWLEFGV